MFNRHNLITLIRQLKEESHIILILKMLKLRLREVNLSKDTQRVENVCCRCGKETLRYSRAFLSLHSDPAFGSKNVLAVLHAFHPLSFPCAFPHIISPASNVYYLCLDKNPMPSNQPSPTSPERMIILLLLLWKKTKNTKRVPRSHVWTSPAQGPESDAYFTPPTGSKRFTEQTCFVKLNTTTSSLNCTCPSGAM